MQSSIIVHYSFWTLVTLVQWIFFIIISNNRNLWLAIVYSVQFWSILKTNEYRFLSRLNQRHFWISSTVTSGKTTWRVVEPLAVEPFSSPSTVRSMTLVNVEFLYCARLVEHFCTHLYKCHPHFKQYQCTVIVRCCYLLCVVREQILYNHRELVYALKSCHPCLCLRFWLFVCIYCCVSHVWPSFKLCVGCICWNSFRVENSKQENRNMLNQVGRSLIKGVPG